MRKRLFKRICEILAGAIEALDRMIDEEVELFLSLKPYEGRHGKSAGPKTDPSKVAGFCSVCGRECIRTRNQEDDVFVVYEGRLLCASCFNRLEDERVEEMD